MEKRTEEFDDLVIDSKLTYKELYNLAVKEGLEDKEIHLVLVDPLNKKRIQCDIFKSIGTGWSKNTSILEGRVWRTPEELSGIGNCQSNA